MKKYILKIFIVLCLGISILLFLLHNASTENNASPEKLYKNDKSIDMLIYDNTAYVNASSVGWMKDLELNENELLGSIKRTKISKNFKNFDATKLKVGSEIYSTDERKDFVLVSTEYGFVPYLKYVEG